VACSTQEPPPPSPTIDPNFTVLDLPAANGSANFLLEANGSGFADFNGNPQSEIITQQEDKTYSTRLILRWSKRVNPNNQVVTYGLRVTFDGIADASHTFSENVPVAFLEVDQTEIPAVRRDQLTGGAFMVVDNRRKADPPTLEIELSPQAIARLVQAKNQISLKVQLKSDRLARSTECLNPAGTVDDYANCQFAYTGRTMMGEELKRLQILFTKNP